MKKKQTPNSPFDDKETLKEFDNENEIPLKDGSDICQQLMDRYSKSSAPQHRHLIATAAAMRSILSSESLPLSPPAYFAASISALDDDSAATLDSTAIGALLTFLSLVVPAVPKGGIASGKAKEAVEVVVRVLGKEGLGVASLRSGVKCLGLLLVGFSDLQDWHSVQFGLESLLGFAIDKRPKVRRCAQEYLEKFFKSFQSSDVMKEADDSKDETLSNPEHLEVLHMLNVLKLTVPYLSATIRLKILSELCKLTSSEFSILTRNIHKTIEVFFGNSNAEAIIPVTENIIVSLSSYVSGEKNPVDTLISAATLLKCAVDKLYAVDSNSWTKHTPLVCDSLAALLSSEASVASHASDIMKELISQHIDLKSLSSDNNGLGSEEADAIKSICSIFENTLSSSDGIPNEHVLAVLTVLFQKLVKKSVIRQDLQAHGHSLWGLLPAFCRYPIDTHKRFKALAELLIDILKEDSLMHENIAVAIQILVNQNKNILRSGEDADESNNTVIGDSKLELRIPATYSKKTATKNIRALSSCASEILQALTDVFVHSIPAKRLYLKDAIGCLASITDSSITKRIFVSLVEKLQSIDGEGEFVKQAGNADEVVEKEKNINTMGKDASRCIIMELASSLISGAEEDLIDFIYVLIKQTFQETNEIGHHEAYYALSKILEEHAWFCSSKSEELIDLLLGLKSPADIPSLRNRLDCFNTLMVHTLKVSSLEENTKPFLILNEIIVTLKDGKEETRKTTYDILLKMSYTLRKSSDLESDPPYHKLISMIMGYLSGSSPHIKSGAVAALSVLVYDDPEICISVPDLVSSILSLLQTKAVEVIKAVLGFVKVLVSTLQAKDLQNFLSDIINGVLKWSSISRNHFRSKVTIILEILTRKCGIAAVQSVAPEKHKGFLNTVIENRRGKTTSEETDVNDADKVPVGSSTEGSGKRRDKGFGAFKSKNDMIEHRKRKRDKRDGVSKHAESSEHVGHGGGMKMAKRAKHFGKPMKSHSEGNGKKKNFDKGSGTSRGQKRKINQATKSQKGEAAGDKRHSFKVQTRPKKFRGVNKKGDK
ncbi:hypothetical protein GOBAR_DD21651 [Gossypium barbadense]|nr:hypothetical protein GOBAR_DD21651 [Gossypium barbadense]